MPIIKCPDCSREMSDAAPACPSCGRPNGNPPTPVRKIGILLGLGILLLPIVFSWFTLRKGHTTTSKVLAFSWLALTLIVMGNQEKGNNNASNTPSTPAAATAAKPAAEPVIKVSARSLISAYDSNEIAADSQYKDKIVEVTGIVGDIKKDLFSEMYVTIGTGAQFEIPQVQAFFDDSMKEQLGKLRKGQQLTAVCRVSGLMMNVLVKDCVIK